MAAQATRPRTTRKTPRAGTQSVPLTRLTILDALRSWVIPTAVGVVSMVVFVIYNIGVLDEPPAVTIVGAGALLVVLFYGVRGFVEAGASSTLAVALAVFAVLWGGTTFYPFYRAINPGTPTFKAALTPHVPVTLPLQGKPGRYYAFVEGHFLPSQGRENRTAVYHIALGGEGTTDRLLEGTFSQEWRSQRVGAGRRSTVVPSLHEITQVRDFIDDPDGRPLTATLQDVSPGLRDTVSLRLYAETLPTWLLIFLGAATMIAAVVVDTWREKGQRDGLMLTLTAATLIALVVFCRSSTRVPGFPQFLIAALLGALGGAVAGSLLWWLTKPLRRYLPRLT